MIVIRFINKLKYRLLRFILLKRVKKHQGELFIGGKTILTSNTILHKNPNFNGMIIQGKGVVEFGDNFHSGENCRIITDVHNYKGNKLPYDETTISKNVIIGDNVWFGYGVIVLGGVTIGSGAIIQAGAVVVCDIPPCAIAGGSPAKVFKYRDNDHYKRLLAANNYL